MRKWGSILLMAVLLTAAPAFGKKKSSKKRSKKKAKATTSESVSTSRDRDDDEKVATGTSFDFEGSLLEGKMKAPSGMILQGRINQSKTQMVKLRENFRRRLKRSRSNVRSIRP